MASTLLSEIRDLSANLHQKYSEVLALDKKLRDAGVPLFGDHIGNKEVRGRFPYYSTMVLSCF